MKKLLALLLFCTAAAVRGQGTWVDIRGAHVTVPVSGTVTGTVTGNQGNPNTSANGWPVKVTDGVTTADVTLSHEVKTHDQNVADTLTSGAAVCQVVGTITANQGSTNNDPTINPWYTAISDDSGTGSVARVDAGTHGLKVLVTNTSISVSPATVFTVDGTSGTFPEYNTARSTKPTNVADGTAVTANADLGGRRIVMLESPRELKVTGNISLTTNAETTLIAAGAAGVFHDLTELVITSDDVTLVANTVSIRDATAGAVIMTVRVNNGAAPIIIPFPASLKQTTAANNWTAQLGAATTATKTISVFAQAVKH